MAVIIRKYVKIGESYVEMKTYQPSETLSKENRKRADKLDDYLSVHIPEIAKQIIATTPSHTDLVRRRYLFGKSLHEIANNRDLVLEEDVKNRLLWAAIWSFLPDFMRPVGSRDIDSYSEYCSKRNDIIQNSYRLSDYDWAEVGWIKSWDNWYRIVSNPIILQNEHVLRVLGEVVSNLKTYPSIKEFMSILRNISEKIDQTHSTNSEIKDKKHITKLINTAVKSSIT